MKQPRRPRRTPAGGQFASRQRQESTDGLDVAAVDADVLHIMGELATTATGRRFRLAEGTALALQLGHRCSNDLDYFVFGERIQAGAILADIERISPAIGRFDVTTSEAGQLDVEVRPLGRKVSFIAYPFALSGKPVVLQGQRCSPPLEIAAMKAYTMGRRAAARDYVDIEAAISLAGVDLSEIVGEARQRFVLDGEPVFSERLFLQQLVSFGDLTDATGLVLLRSSWGDVQRSLRRIVASYVENQIG